jgi:hypothetical protein
VRDLGGTVALVDHDALTAGDMNTAIRRVPRGLGHALVSRLDDHILWLPGAGSVPDLADVDNALEHSQSDRD